MKKRSLKNLALNRKPIADLSANLNGGRLKAMGESLFNTVCPMCETEDCPVVK